MLAAAVCLMAAACSSRTASRSADEQQPPTSTTSQAAGPVIATPTTAARAPKAAGTTTTTETPRPPQPRTTTTSTVPAVASQGLEFDAPSGLAFGGRYLWVTNYNGNSVAAVDPSNGAWVATYRGAGYGFDRPSAITDVGSDLFVADAAGFVTELDATNGAAVRTIRGAGYHFADPVAIASSHDTLLVLNAGQPPSVTEIDIATGKLIRVASSPGFDDPVAMAVWGDDAFVANQASNAVTEVDVLNGVQVGAPITSPGHISSPDGIAAEDGYVWVSDSATNAATQIDAATRQVMRTVNDGSYGFNTPSVALAWPGYVFIATPNGTSPMVTMVNAATGAGGWNGSSPSYVCNTNGPYYFSNISAMAVSGDDLWVASRTGDNYPAHSAEYGSLTELSTTRFNGLLRTVS